MVWIWRAASQLIGRRVGFVFVDLGNRFCSSIPLLMTLMMTEIGVDRKGCARDSLYYLFRLDLQERMPMTLLFPACTLYVRKIVSDHPTRFIVEKLVTCSGLIASGALLQALVLSSHRTVCSVLLFPNCLQKWISRFPVAPTLINFLQFLARTANSLTTDSRALGSMIHESTT